MNQKFEHLTIELLYAFNNNTLDDETYLSVLNHISSCDNCSILYSNTITKKDIITAPHYLKSNIMERIQRSNEIVNIVEKQKISINRQLFFYSIKVGLAMCGALIFLYSGLLSKEYSSEAKELPMIKMDTVDNINNKLYEFSNKLIMEENNYDKEKK